MEQRTRLTSLYNRAEKDRINKEVNRLAEEEKQADIEKTKSSSKATEEEDSTTLGLHLLQFVRQDERYGEGGEGCHEQTA